MRPDAEFRSRDDGEEGEIPRPSFGKEWIYAFRNSATLFAASRPEFTWLPNAVPGMLMVYLSLIHI